MHIIQKVQNPPVNLIAQSQSGTGKTAAFLLNILSRIDLSPAAAKTPQAIVIVPTRELARQIIGVIEVMGRFVEGLKVDAGIPVAASESNSQSAVDICGYSTIVARANRTNSGRWRMCPWN